MAAITRNDVKQAAAAHNMGELEALTMMQAAAAKLGRADVLEALCTIKAEIIGL